MDIRFVSPPPPAEEGGTLVVAVLDEDRLGAAAEQLDGATGGAVRRALQAAGGKLRRGRFVELLGLPPDRGPGRVLLMGLGKADGASPLDLEIVGGGLAVKLAGLRAAEAAVAVDAAPFGAFGPAELAARLAAGARLRAYRFDRYKSAGKGGGGSGGDDEENGNGGRSKGVAALTFVADDPAAAEAAYADAARVVDGVAHARDLVSEPANVLHPKAFTDQCEALGELGLDVQVLDRAALRELHMNALLGVAQGSARDPYVVVMRWTGGPAEEPPVALVGKGVCFDTGGISIKPSAGMEDMKFDMAGAGAVFGAMKALAGRRAKANVVGVIGLAENMPSGTAQRPGDVVTAMSGTTIEVVNTDAEGRLLLADVLWYTRDRFKPKAMVDLATLTGAIVVALGHESAGLFTPDDALADRLLAAGKAVGEPLWRMPLGEPYAKHIKSDIADIKNVGRAREAGATAGAVFLQRFVGDTPWAHLDIAGTAWTKHDQPLAGKGATGFGVRLLDRLVRDHFEQR